MGKDDLPKTLRDDLEKSGFGAELSALRVFHGAPFRTTAGQVYFDKVLGTQRQIDLAAFDELMTTVDKWIYQTVIAVWAEVKKSENPWVVLKTSTYENPYNIFLTDSLINEYNAPAKQQYRMHEELAKHAISVRDSWFGHGVHGAFKKPDELGRWFKAASSISRAAWTAVSTARQQQENLSTVELTQPLVILKGRLFSAASDANYEMELTEINRATILYRETNALFDRRFLIDLVVLDSLPNYIKELKERLRIAHSELMKRVGR